MHDAPFVCPEKSCDLGELISSVQSLADRFKTLKERVSSSIVESLHQQLAPDLSVVNECREAVTDYRKLELSWIAVGLPPGSKLDSIVMSLRTKVDEASWENARNAGRRLLSDIQRLTHKSSAPPSYLIAVQGCASDTAAELEKAHSEFKPEIWIAKLKPFQALWRYLTTTEVLSEKDAETLLTEVEASFGRAMMLAVATQKIVMNVDTEQAQAVPSQCPSSVVDSGDASLNSSVQSTSSSETPASAEALDIRRETTSAPAILTSNSSIVPHSIDSTIHSAIASPELITGSPPNDLRCMNAAASKDLESHSAFVSPAEMSPRHDLDSGHAVPPSRPPVEVDRQEVHATVWELLGSGRAGMAYQVAECWAALDDTELVEPPAFFLAAAVAPYVRCSFGEVVDRFRECITELVSMAGASSAVNELATARRLTLFGLALRPTLLAPASGATSILQSVAMLDGIFPAIGRVRQAVAGFGAANIELSPSVLKGVQDHAKWASELQKIRDNAHIWLQRNRSGKIIYAATTDVWHRWLRDDGPLGQILRIVIDDRRSELSQVRKAIKDWADIKWVERQMHTTDLDIRKNGARRKPIEARARIEVCDRAQEFTQVISGWLDHLAGERHALDDYRQKRADEVREDVANSLTDALAEIDREADGGTPILASATLTVQRALLDLQRLFDPTHEEDEEIPPVRVLLGEELLAIPDLSLTADWQPAGATDLNRLRRILATCTRRYDPEEAFRTQSELRNHVRTNQIIEALEAYRRHDQKQLLANRLKDERSEAVRQCRNEFEVKLSKTRANIERAVCYDLVGGDDRSHFAECVERYSAGLDDLFDFAGAAADLDRIDLELAARQSSRVELVKQKLVDLTQDRIPVDRLADIQVIRLTLDRGDFLSAEEYLELVRSGQPLTRIIDSERSVFREYFVWSDGRPGFVRQFDDFMNGPLRPQPRDVIDRIRNAESIGPIDMSGVPEPQAKEAAEMIESWLRLKDMKDRAVDVPRYLNTLLSRIGFKNVRTDPVIPVKPPHWLVAFHTTELNNPSDCIVPQFGSLARGKYRVLGVYDRPNEESLVELTKELPGVEPLIVLYFGRMTEQRRRDLADFSQARNRGFLTIDESMVYFLCGERFSRLPIFFQCAFPFTVVKPYTTTSSLVPTEMFFGRQQEREQVTAIDGTNLVYGGRQLGKSALLRDIERRSHNPSSGQIVRWIDLKNRGIGINRPTQDIWAEIGQDLHREGVLSAPGTTHDTVAKRIKEWIKSDNSRRILLLLDEADGFFEMDSKAPVEGRQSYPEVARLKGLMDDTDRRFKVVFAGLHNVQRAARDPNTPLGHLGTPVCIGPLLENGEWKQARNLIEVPLRHMGYELDPSDLWMRILSYTNYYPSLIQVFCKHLLEHLHNKDQTKFDFRRCPPYRVTAEQVERVYQSKALREEVSHKFELTLGLDPRYRLIALRIALDSLEHLSGQPDGVDVGWVRSQALDYWVAGFGADDRGYESFRTILDEMVGLGILRRAGDDRYALRSPNLLNLLGSKGQIETKLEDVMARPPAPVYDAAAFRRSLDGDRWDHSPLTAEQEATMAEPANGVIVVFASALAGLERLTAGIKAIPHLVGVEVLARRLTQPAQFEAWLREIDDGRGPLAEGVTLAIVEPSSYWTSHWIRLAGELLSRKKSSRKRFLRVVFVADTLMGWDWGADGAPTSLGATEITLRPWHETALSRWAAEAEIGDSHRVCEAIRSRLGGWYKLVTAFAKACRDQSAGWESALDKVVARWPNDPEWIGCCDIPDDARSVLSAMADYRDPIQSADLEVLVGTAHVQRTITWADRFAFIQRADNEIGEWWTLDPVLRSYIIGGGR